MVQKSISRKFYPINNATTDFIIMYQKPTSAVKISMPKPELKLIDLKFKNESFYSSKSENLNSFTFTKKSQVLANISQVQKKLPKKNERKQSFINLNNNMFKKNEEENSILLPQSSSNYLIEKEQRKFSVSANSKQTDSCLDFYIKPRGSLFKSDRTYERTSPNYKTNSYFYHRNKSKENSKISTPDLKDVSSFNISTKRSFLAPLMSDEAQFATVQTYDEMIFNELTYFFSKEYILDNNFKQEYIESDIVDLNKNYRLSILIDKAMKIIDYIEILKEKFRQNKNLNSIKKANPKMKLYSFDHSNSLIHDEAYDILKMYQYWTEQCRREFL